MSTYPVAYHAAYEEQRNRLTVFFRYFLAIPQFIFVAIVGIVAYIGVIVAWFAIVFTGKYPEGIYNFVAGVVRAAGRANGYLYLLTDQYPPFSLDQAAGYPIQITIGPPKAEYSRVKTLFRIFLVIIPAIIGYALTIVSEIVAIIAWFIFVITGKNADWIQNGLLLGLRYNAKLTAYGALLTEDWPPMGATPEDESGQVSGGGAGAAVRSGPVAGLENPEAAQALGRDPNQA